MINLKTAKNKAIKLAGGHVAMASHLGLSRQAVHQWDKIPVERVWEIAEITGLRPSEMRPDIFKE